MQQSRKTDEMRKSALFQGESFEEDKEKNENRSKK